MPERDTRSYPEGPDWRPLGPKQDRAEPEGRGPREAPRGEGERPSWKPKGVERA